MKKFLRFFIRHYSAPLIGTESVWCCQGIRGQACPGLVTIFFSLARGALETALSSVAFPASRDSAGPAFRQYQNSLTYTHPVGDRSCDRAVFEAVSQTILLFFASLSPPSQFCSEAPACGRAPWRGTRGLELMVLPKITLVRLGWSHARHEPRYGGPVRNIP